jgi:molybdopterin-guanine dinucleotide biosynthesis protein A
MGADKGLLLFRGKPLVEHVLAVMHRVCPRVTVVGEGEKFSGYGAVVADLFPGCGPLGGIHAGLRHSAAELNLFLAVDMPFVSAELLAVLFTAAEQSQALVIVPRTARGLQPLCAVYRPGFAGIAEDALRAGKYKIDAAFAGLGVHEIAEAELVAAGFSERNFFNVNTPGDWAEVEQSGKLP